MEMQTILEDLKYNTGVFPRESMLEAVKNRDAIIPGLLKTIEYSRENIESLVNDEDYFAHMYAMYLLAQFREPRAYRALVDFFSIPGEITLDFTGDVVTEDLARMLASVHDGDSGLLKTLVENENADGYVRAAAVKTFSVLWAAGKMSRGEIINYFKELFDGRLERSASGAWNSLVIESTDLYLEELYEEIKAAFDDDLVDDAYTNFGNVEDDFKREKDQVLGKLKGDRSYSLIDDAIRELEHLPCFAEKPEIKKVKPKKKGRKKKKGRNKKTASSPASPASHVETPGKIPKNKPCPCGSGRKYKKCCMTNLEKSPK